MSTPLEATRCHNLTKLLILLPLRDKSKSTFQCETPCSLGRSRDQRYRSSNICTLRNHQLGKNWNPWAVICELIKLSCQASKDHPRISCFQWKNVPWYVIILTLGGRLVHWRIKVELEKLLHTMLWMQILKNLYLIALYKWNYRLS